VSFAIEDANQIAEVWSKTYNTQGKPDWSHILPYYSDIVDQRDYYDLWGDIFDNNPHFSRMYRTFMKKFFG
jgi:hypothetical protein